MSKAGFDSERVTTNFKRLYKNVLSLVVSNYGNAEINVSARGVTRPLPPLHETLNVPVAPFKIESFGNELDVEISIDFPDGSGNAIIDTITLIKC